MLIDKYRHFFAVLGNMWGQQWNNIYSLVEPYSGVEELDVTDEMLRQVRHTHYRNYALYMFINKEISHVT